MRRPVLVNAGQSVFHLLEHRCQSERCVVRRELPLYTVMKANVALIPQCALNSQKFFQDRRDWFWNFFLKVFDRTIPVLKARLEYFIRQQQQRSTTDI